MHGDMSKAFGGLRGCSFRLEHSVIFGGGGGRGNAPGDASPKGSLRHPRHDFIRLKGLTENEGS